MDRFLVVFESLFLLISLYGRFDHLDNLEVQLLTMVAAGLTCASRHHGEPPQQLIRGDVRLSVPFVYRNTLQRGKVLTRRRMDDPGRWS